MLAQLFHYTKRRNVSIKSPRWLSAITFASAATSLSLSLFCVSIFIWLLLLLLFYVVVVVVVMAAVIVVAVVLMMMIVLLD